MLQQLQFYARHSINDLRVNGQRTLFALLCIAAGVAAIVSLQTLAGMIQNTLTSNLQASNRGDVVIEPVVSFIAGEDELRSGVDEGVLTADPSDFGTGGTTYFTAEGIARIEQWLGNAAGGAVDVTGKQAFIDFSQVFLGGGIGATLTRTDTALSASQITPVMIDSAVYPFYSEITTLDGTTLADAINAPTDIVLGELAAEKLDVTEVGTVLVIEGSDQQFTVRGIVEDSAEVKSPSEALLALFGFYYIDESALPLFSIDEPRTATLYARLPEGSDVTQIDTALTEAFPYIRVTTTEDLREAYEDLSENINQLVTIMGLVSLLIGSFGIVNTMQVIVRRRTVEVAVLKTIGLQAGQVTWLFLVEAVLMGIVGSILGVVLGWLAVFVVRGAAETLLATSLPFVFAPSAAVNGIVVGVVVTTVFGFLPTLSAGQVRPGLVLRPNDELVPRAGCLRTLLALALIIVVLTLVTFTILPVLPVAFGVIVGTFIVAGFLYGLLWLMIGLVGRFFPSFGLPALKIALRQMLAGRRRAAMTLLALVVGVFSLSLITLLAESILGLLQTTLESDGNITIFVGQPNQRDDVLALVEGFEGVQQYKVQSTYRGQFVSLEENGVVVPEAELHARLLANGSIFMPPNMEVDVEELVINNFETSIASIGARGADELPEVRMLQGRQLSADDASERRIVLQRNMSVQAAGIDVGDRLNYTIGGREGFLGIGATEGQPISFEVVGLYDPASVQLSLGAANSNVYALTSAFPEAIAPDVTVILAQVDDAQIPALRRALSAYAFTFLIENAMLANWIQAVTGAFTAFPTMVAALGLVVGGVVIANSVALTTLERRREIAILKAVGLQRERVLLMLLLENGLLGFIGGLIGVGIGLLGLILIFSTTDAISRAIPFGTAFVLMGLCVVVALVAAMTTAWGAAGEKPLNVLRYE